MEDLEKNSEFTPTSFCVSGIRPAVCPTPKFDEFPDETDLIILLLSYLQTYVPDLLSRVSDCRNKKIKIKPTDIGVNIPKSIGNYLILLVPTDDLSVYNDDRYQIEQARYVFQLQVQVKEKNFECSLENILKVKNVLKTLLVNMYYNLNLNVEIQGFNHDSVDIDEDNTYIRRGTYTFIVNKTQPRILK